MFNDIKAFAFDIDGVFTDGGVLAMPDGDLLRTFNSKDCFAVRTAVNNGYPVAIITGGCSQSLLMRARSLGVSDADLFQLSKNKLSDLKWFCEKHNLQLSDIAFIGDDIPDIEPIKASGLGCCPSDAVGEVKDACDYISPYEGGRGCVRDILEKVLKMQKRWTFNPEESWKGSHPENITTIALSTGRYFKE